MPVLQKAFYRIYLYMPGMNVISATAGSEQHAVGQRQRALGYTIDGVNAKEPVFGNPNNFDTVMTSTLDMIQEFKMYTTGLPAEFGHSSGGQLSGVMKSGTNQFHGSAEDRYLNGKLVHRQYFEQLRRCQASVFSSTIIPCNPFTYHEMGATAGTGADSSSLQRKGQDVLLRRVPAPSREGHRDFHRQCTQPR